jgi:hypothetical protein
MRLSEKSIELNFCHQVSTILGHPSWWFGTTQRQEREAGWDVARQIAGRWIRFQLKASNHVLTNGRRQFRGHHHQLVDLQAHATTPLSVFYVFPTIGSTAELIAAGFDLIPHLWLLDVHGIPPMNPPATAAGPLRKSGLHYFDLNDATGSVTIHSDPVDVGAQRLEGLGADIRGIIRAGIEDSVEPERGVADSQEFLRGGRNRVAAFLPF